MWNPFKRPIVAAPNTRQSPLYQYRLGRRFDPGAQGEVFEPTFSLPVILFRGSGRVCGSLGKFQPPQVYVNAQIRQVGIGGIQAGQYFSQALLDPSQIGEGGGGE